MSYTKSWEITRTTRIRCGRGGRRWFPTTAGPIPATGGRLRCDEYGAGRDDASLPRHERRGGRQECLRHTIWENAMKNCCFDLDGRVAVVIGGTSGLGKAIALGLASHGAN